MTTQLVFSQRNEANDTTLTQSRDVSLKSAVKDIDYSIEDFNRRVATLVATLDNVNNLLKACYNQLVVIEWATKELCAFMKELYELPTVTKTTTTSSNGGKTTTTTITYPHLATYNAIKAKYAKALGL